RNISFFCDTGCEYFSGSISPLRRGPQRAVACTRRNAAVCPAAALLVPVRLTLEGVDGSRTGDSERDRQSRGRSGADSDGRVESGRTVRYARFEIRGHSRKLEQYYREDKSLASLNSLRLAVCSCAA